MKEIISVLGCGWLGKPLAKELIKFGYLVKGSTRSTERQKELIDIGIEPDIISLENLDSNLTGFLNAEILIIALPSKNIEGFKQLISEIEKSPIRKIIFISSTSVYKAENKIVTENSPLQSSPLVEIEQLFISNKNFKTTVVRFAGLFGYNRNPGNFFNNGKIIPNPKGFVNFIHQDDCVQILIRIIKNDFWNEVFNACNDSHPNRKKFYCKVKNDLGKEIPIFDELNNFNFKIVSNEKLKLKLNYKFKYNDLMSLEYSKLNIYN